MSAKVIGEAKKKKGRHLRRARQHTSFLDPLLERKVLRVGTDAVARSNWPRLETRCASAKMRGYFVMIPPAAQESGPFWAEGIRFEKNLHGVAFFLVRIVDLVWKFDVLEVACLCV